MTPEQKQQLIHKLSAGVTDARVARMKDVLQNRTAHLTLVLEDIYQSHNISASLRSAECFGLTDAHVIEQQHRYSVNVNVTKGASAWMKLHRYNNRGEQNIVRCYAALRARGYAIVATSPHSKGYELHDLPIDKPMALVFGTEELGLSEYALKHADMFVRIPMYGFTESFNISVSASICLYDIATRLHQSDIAWQLTSEEQQDMLLTWLRNTVSGSHEIERRFLETLIV